MLSASRTGLKLVNFLKKGARTILKEFSGRTKAPNLIGPSAGDEIRAVLACSFGIDRTAICRAFRGTWNSLICREAEASAW
jgi:hypothetical protein